jgi:hypothetical protein
MKLPAMSMFGFGGKKGPPPPAAPQRTVSAGEREVQAWLAGQNLGRWWPNFQEYGCDTMEMVRELEEADLVTLAKEPTKMPALHEKKIRRAINAAGGNVLVGDASGGSDSAPEDLEELKAWLRGLKPNFERYLPNFEQHGCVSMRMVRELTDEKFRALIQTPDAMKGMHLKKFKIAIKAAGGTISDEFSASSDDGIPLAKMVYEGGGGGGGGSGGEPRVFIGGLFEYTTEEAIKQHFCQYGQVESVQITKDAAGTPRGFGFVFFAETESASRCVMGGRKQTIGSNSVEVTY